MSDVLGRIEAYKRQEIAAAKAAVSQAELERRIAAVSPPRGFAAAIERHLAEGRPALIAEVKKASPSKGLIRADFDPPSLAKAYAEGGATCLSVLTDEEFFAGSASDLAAARTATSLPVLRKDFTVDPRDAADARLMNADAVLLIAAALDPFELVELHQVTGRDASRLRELVEAHLDTTGSARAAELLADWSTWRPQFRKVMPKPLSARLAAEMVEKGEHNEPARQ